ncbi:hypothetical protein BFR09_11960 [Shigella sp. FC1172]|nr:hypothetical protein BFR09_11960 [Shigella sp. FC1172]
MSPRQPSGKNIIRWLLKKEQMVVSAIASTPHCSMLIMRLFFSPTRSFWQELAWLLSAVFWCALGALCFLFISSLFKPQHRKNQ